MKKSSAISHPIQGLIKYHGLKDETLRIPFQDSISVCTAPYSTKTTVEFSEKYTEDTVEIGENEVSGREKERVLYIVDHLRKMAKTSLKFRMKSVNDFPSNIGLGASSSGFAALSKASADALGLSLSLQEVSKVARLGAGSACRAVTGSFSYWKKGSNHEDSYAYAMVDPKTIPLSMVIIPVNAFKHTENAHKEAVTSPLFQARLPYAEKALKKMEEAIAQKDVEKIGWLAEQDTLNLHAITMTGETCPIYWRPETIKIMLETREMRKEKIPVYFSIDTGATVYLNTVLEWTERVKERMKRLGFSPDLAEVGRETRSIENHLF